LRVLLLRYIVLIREEVVLAETNLLSKLIYLVIEYVISIFLIYI
jgi:hypothetical protein